MIPEKPPWPDFPHPKKWDNFFGDLYDFIQSRQPINGDGLTWQETAGGLRPVVDVSATAAAVKFPFQLINASDKNGLKVRVRLGTVQTGNTSLIVPAGMTAFTDTPPFILSVSATKYVVLGVDLDSAHNWNGLSADISLMDVGSIVNTASRVYFILGDVGVIDGVLLIGQGTRYDNFSFLTIGQITPTAPLTFISSGYG